jgi:hypothetical protein
MANTSTCDALVEAVVTGAAGSRIYTSASHREADLVEAVRKVFVRDGQSAPSKVEPRYRLDGWTRPPGGVDLAADLYDGSGRLLMEMKVGKPDEAIWDAIKLADIVTQNPEVLAAYLIYGATADRWAPATPVARLFLDPPAQASSRELIAWWPSAWADLLFGGDGIRPTESADSIAFSLIGSVKAVAHSGHVIKTLRVQATDDALDSYDTDGWPTGYEPPSGLRAIVLAREERRRLRRLESASPPDHVDPCHGYPWYATWTQRRLVNVVPGLDDPAYLCLRDRLKLERGWGEDELEDRVDPLRPGK